VFQIGCLVLFLALVVGRAVSLRVRVRVNPIAFRLRKRGLLGVVELAFFVQVNLWAVAVVVYSIPGLRPPGFWVFSGLPLDVTWVKLLGALTIAIGFAIFVAALRSLGSSWRLGIDESHPGRLVTTGIYALSRNPVYTFFDLYFIGTYLVNGTWLFLALAVLTVLNLHYQILHEERFLASVHGHAYQSYRDRTARYWTWRRVLQPYRKRAMG
jgi:protein-S-isoprenylcysteine O-methyltransferase Ste14